MAALAYLLLPISGTIAYFSGSTVRTRFHGLQAVIYGTIWPGLLYAASAVAAGATRVVFVAGAVGWVVLMAATAAGRDPAFPVLATVLKRWASEPAHGANPDEG